MVTSILLLSHDTDGTKMTTQIPPYVAPYKPVPQVTPLTYRDGITMLKKLELLQRYINKELVPFVNDNMEQLGDDFETQANALIEAVNAAIDMVINDSVEVQDPVVAELVANATSATNDAIEALNAAIMNNAASATRVITDGLYAGKGTAVIAATDYGVIGDGVTLNTTALQNAINAATIYGKAGVVKLPLGVILTGAITIPQNVSLVGAGKHLSIIKQSGTPAWLVTAAGTITPDVTVLTATASFGDSVLTVGSTASLAVNDLIVLHDSVSYTTTDSTYKSGEMFRIKEITSATQVTVWGVVRGSWGTANGQYTAANAARISKINPKRGITIADLSFEGDSSSTTGMLLAQWASKVTVRNVDVIKSGSYGIRFDGVYMGEIRGYSASDLTDNLPNLNVGYAIAVTGPSEKITVNGAQVSRARHGFTTMGGQYGFPHDVMVTAMNVTDCTVAGIDNHAAGEDISIVGNIVSQCAGGITTRARGVTISGNRISKIPTGHGINVAELNLKNIVIKGNTVEDIITGGHGIVVGAPCANLTIEDNTVSRVGADGIRVDAGSTSVLIDRNTVRNVGMAVVNRNHIAPATTSGSPATPATSGWFMTHNTLIQDAGVGSANRAIDTNGGSLTNAYVALNMCAGTFVSQPFNNTNPFGMLNRQIGQAPPTITGAKGGNAALTSVIARMVSDGLVVDGTT